VRKFSFFACSEVSSYPKTQIRVSLGKSIETSKERKDTFLSEIQMFLESAAMKQMLVLLVGRADLTAEELHPSSRERACKRNSSLYWSLGKDNAECSRTVS
jgi:hypothetical protein